MGKVNYELVLNGFKKPLRRDVLNAINLVLTQQIDFERFKNEISKPFASFFSKIKTFNIDAFKRLSKEETLTSFSNRLSECEFFNEDALRLINKFLTVLGIENIKLNQVKKAV